MDVLRSTITVAVVVVLAQCKPELGGRVSQIEGPRLLAVRSTPAEVRPGAAVTYDALEVDPNGERSDAIDWAYCSIRKPLDDLDTVSPDCLAQSGMGIAEIGIGGTASGTLPTDACRNFGPDVPSPLPGQPPARPVDPDPTGGYYQPLRVSAFGDAQIATTRAQCGVANASSTDTATYGADYHANTNPMIADVTSDSGMSLSQDANAPSMFAVNARVIVTVSWPACPTSDVCGDGVCGADESAVSCMQDCTPSDPPTGGCAGAERYVGYDTSMEMLVVTRETMRASWFVTSGAAFDSDHTGTDGTDLTLSTSDGLTLPSVAGPVHGWVVLRDDRGGVAWRRFEIAVQ